METPFNENLKVSTTGCSSAFIAALVPSVPAKLGSRLAEHNEFYAGLQQAIGEYVVIDGEYIWKYTHNGYDFSNVSNIANLFPDRMAQLKN